MSLTMSDLSGQPYSSANPQAERDVDKIRMEKCKNYWNSQKYCPEIGNISHMLKLILFEVTENNFVPNFASVLLLSQSRMKIKYK